ncbi:hypothetical protein JCM11491_000206 [Sporobolomyces phaffii]
MSAYGSTYPEPLSFDLPVSPFVDPALAHPPPPATQFAPELQPGDWQVRTSPGFARPAPGGDPHAYPHAVPGGVTMRPPSVPQWGFPRGGAIHPAVGMPDELLPKTYGPAGSELVKVTGKSCASCRTRKVKCDRRYPHCSRCIKRKDPCEYGDDVSFALRPIVSLTRPRENDSSDSNNSSPRTANFPAVNANNPHQRLPSSSLALPYPPPRLPSETSPSRSLRTVSDFRHQLARTDKTDLLRGGETSNDRRPELQQLWDRFLHQSNLGESSSDWRLALPAMASSLTLHLLEASMKSCCYHLPAFHVFNPSVAYYKQNLNTLDVASQAAVGILASLGARASPHSALLGVAGPDIENGNASHELVLSAGIRRENAWRAIVKQATDLCSKLEVMQVPSVINAQTLVAFVQMLMFAEVKPKTARFFLRAALGLFYDMQGGGLSHHEIDLIKRSVGTTLFESDARISAWLSLPPLISEDDLFDYFDGTGVHLVDLERENLSDQLTALFDSARGPMSSETGAEALRITGFYVCAVQRLFAKICSTRRPSNRFLQSIERLWEYIDGAHAACQLLTGTLRAFAMAQDDHHHSAHHDLLIGLRMHERLLDVMNLSNEWLRSKRNDHLSSQDRHDLEKLLGTSNRRVRRCLKVLAFYAKVFHDSHDKHVVYHLFTQLEAVEGWAAMAAQREDEEDEFGVLGSECVLTELELDYFSQALELSCFYTPLSAHRLQEFNRARQSRNHPTPRFASIEGFDISSSRVEPTRQPGYANTTPSRFSDIQIDPPSNPSFLPLITASTASYNPAIPSPDFAAMSDPSEAHTGWVLNGYADTSNSCSRGATDSESPPTSSSSISPGYHVESGSGSPDALLASSTVPPPTGPLDLDAPEYFTTSLGGSQFFPSLPRSQTNGAASYATGTANVSFPTATVTNLLQPFASEYPYEQLDVVGNGGTTTAEAPAVAVSPAFATGAPRHDTGATRSQWRSHSSNWKGDDFARGGGDGGRRVDPSVL